MSNMRLIEYVRYWLENIKKRKLKESSYDRYLTQADTLEKYSIAQMRICDIVADDITAYLYELVDTGYAYSTIKKQKTIVEAPLKHAFGNKYITVNITEGVEMPRQDDVKKPQRIVKDFSPQEQKRLWAEIEKFESYCDYVIGFMLETGLRINEALALVWDDLDRTRPFIHVHKTVMRLGKQKITTISDSPKSFSSIRGVPLTPRALSILKVLEATAPNEWIFSDEDGTRLSYDSVRSRMKTICKRSGVKYQPPHATRHTLTTNLFDAGVDAKTISKILGHSNEEVSKNVYKHLREDGFDQMYDALMQITQ